jgi:alpha-glucoside transport system permease protein
MATAAAEARRPAVLEESAATRILRVVLKTPLHLLLLLIALLWLIPAFGLFLTSLLAPTTVNEGGWWQALQEPSLITIDNYQRLLENDAMIDALWTTVQISILGTLLPILVASLAGYAFAWLEFPGRDWLFIGVIAMLVVPLQMALIPMFSLYNRINIGDFRLFDSVLSLVLFHTAFGLPFAIFLLRNFFIGIPRELLEAARIDGASELRIFLRVVLPLGLPAIASLAIFQFLWTWNDLLVALTFGRETQPITVAIFSQLRQFGANIDLIASASFVSLAIPLIVFFSFQRYFVQGLLAGSVK